VRQPHPESLINAIYSARFGYTPDAPGARAQVGSVQIVDRQSPIPVGRTAFDATHGYRDAWL